VKDKLFELVKIHGLLVLLFTFKIPLGPIYKVGGKIWISFIGNLYFQLTRLPSGPAGN
jgi:hypothetical protein